MSDDDPDPGYFFTSRITGPIGRLWRAIGRAFGRNNPGREE